MIMFLLLLLISYINAGLRCDVIRSSFTHFHVSPGSPTFDGEILKGATPYLILFVGGGQAQTQSSISRALTWIPTPLVRIVFIGPMCLWGPIYGSGSLTDKLSHLLKLNDDRPGDDCNLQRV